MPLASDATHNDVVTRLNQLHKCIELNAKNTNKKITNLAKSSSATRRAITELTINQKKLVDSLGLTEENKKKPLAFVSERKAFMAMAGGIAAVTGVWKFIDFAFPYVFKFIVDFQHAIHTGQF